jgi:hypothetical protein
MESIESSSKDDSEKLSEIKNCHLEAVAEIKLIENLL